MSKSTNSEDFLNAINAFKNVCKAINKNLDDSILNDEWFETKDDSNKNKQSIADKVRKFYTENTEIADEIANDIIKSNFYVPKDLGGHLIKNGDTFEFTYTSNRSLTPSLISKLEKVLEEMTGFNWVAIYVESKQPHTIIKVINF